MGQEGSRPSLRRNFVIDAGALIALERGSQEIRAVLERALSPRGEIVIPATALAQAWRGGPRSARMVRFLQKSQIDALDEKRAKEVGTRLGARDKTDIADGHVVSCAVERQAVVLTSDLDDMKALANPGERLRLIAI